MTKYWNVKKYILAFCDASSSVKSSLLLWFMFDECGCFVQLHESEYDTGKALQALVKVINPKSIDKRWSDDDAVRINLQCLSILVLDNVYIVTLTL